MSLLNKITRIFRKPKPRRIDFRIVTYREGFELVREGWTIAPEEDRNRQIGWVCMELLEGAKCQSCQRGYAGTDGNGYQPCSCMKGVP